MKESTEKKDFVVIYRAKEHYEVLGFVRAGSIGEAKEMAPKIFDYEADYYEVRHAMIFEISKGEEILFGMSRPEKKPR
ncbi:MAG: hypothetical protein V1493_01690 [Candidatus Diapherotrites archaeon]